MAETCPCCGYRTLPERGRYDLCPVCWWEDDGARTDAASLDGPNAATLAEGQRLYQRYGTSALHGVKEVRPPNVDEARDPAWAPLSRPDADPVSEFMRDTGQLLEVATEEARDTSPKRTRNREDIGRFLGLRDAYALVVTQADSFGIHRLEVGVDPDLDLERDLLLDPPRGFFAG